MKPYSPRRKEQSQLKGKFHPRGPQSKKIEQEFARARKDILVCRRCNIFYWYKSWHHSLEDYPELKEDKEITFVLCPACQMVKDKKYEGEIILENVPENWREDITRLAENYGKRAFEADPLDRIISIEESKIKRATAKRKRGASSRKELQGLGVLRIFTTENQLAKRLAKKIKETYGGKPKVSISHSDLEDVVRIRIRF